MEYFEIIKDMILHLDKHLDQLIDVYGTFTYFILFAVVFCETGVVITPFLPGDSLLFAAGAIASLGSLDVYTLMFVLFIAAVLGDTSNYFIGKYVGPRVFYKENVRFLNKEHLNKTQRFYEKYGAKTIILARFLPIIRTFAPFVAGIGCMSFDKFMRYNLIGGALWVCSFCMLGYWFGQQPIVKDNFSFVILAIIIISLIPLLIEFIRARNVKE